MTFTSPRLLLPTDDTDKFDCGEPDLTAWLKKFALANNASGTSRTFITTQDSHVMGFYALATGSVQRAQAPSRIGKGQPQTVPVILLARLGVDQTVQRQGVGRQLLRDAIGRSVLAADEVGVRALLVHALHERAKQFYLRFDFEPSPTDDLHLFLLMKDAREIVRAAIRP